MTEKLLSTADQVRADLRKDATGNPLANEQLTERTYGFKALTVKEATIGGADLVIFETYKHGTSLPNGDEIKLAENPFFIIQKNLDGTLNYGTTFLLRLSQAVFATPHGDGVLEFSDTQTPDAIIKFLVSKNDRGEVRLRAVNLDSNSEPSTSEQGGNFFRRMMRMFRN